ncbi:MAG: M20/M25/M40 family metallo-hydrolase [Actinomycetia bacterium]|nr:M20/M25/M40 family metallo-hydrolase [Actinomycetes bacterium]
MTADPPNPAAEDDVVELCRDLIRIDSSNYGDGSGPGERAAAEYVAERLAEVGLQPEYVETGPGRGNVVARVEGTDPSRPGLLIHGHLDVVPATAADWSVPPFSGEIADGCLWGRGAVDMKDMDAMALAVVRQRLREGRRPERDVVLAFLADEEAGGRHGAHRLVETHAHLFEGVTEGIGEVGGFSFTAGDVRLYLIQTAEKGLAWMRLTATGRAGHGSMTNDDNAVTELCEAVARLGRHRFPVRVTKTVRRFLDEVSDALGVTLDPDDMDAVIARLGPIAILIGATLRNTVNPSMLSAGYKVNVIPAQAQAHVDGRFLPGFEEEFFAEVDGLLGPKVQREFVVHDVALETEFEGRLVDAACAALRAEDPVARPVPYTLSGGTDAKAFARLGIPCIGFAPLQLPPMLDFAGMFHGVDERVPVDGLRFGVRVLDRFLDLA